MHDFRDDYEMDEHGKLRKKQRVLPDGATMHIPMGFYDGRFFPTFADGSPDPTNPHMPGFRFSDSDDPLRIAADQAYEQMRQRLNDAYKHRQQVTPAADKRDTAPPPAPNLDQLQAQAQQAWEARNEQMRNAWRTSKEA